MFDKISLLAPPKHRIRPPRDTQETEVNFGWGPFALLKFDIVRYDDVRK